MYCQQRVCCGHLHHQLRRGVPVCSRELPGQHPGGGKQQTATEDPTGNNSTKTVM